MTPAPSSGDRVAIARSTRSGRPDKISAQKVSGSGGSTTPIVSQGRQHSALC